MMNLDDLLEPNQKLQAPELKTIYVVIAGTGDNPEYYRPVKIPPGTTALNILLELNLANDFVLEKAGGSVFAPDEDVYAAVTDKQKVYALKDDVRAGAPRRFVS